MINDNGIEDGHFGQELILNLYDCEIKKITDKNVIENFVINLCDKVIMMKRYGEAFIPHFGHDNPLTSGYSLVQLIETSSITAHFSEYKRAVYLNIFSCRWFDAKAAANFAKKWFGAKKSTQKLVQRI